MTKKITCDLGNRGAAYDGPDYLRAYTFTHQPHNDHAFRLGQVCLDAMEMSAGDLIDRGLGLLKALEAKGYGVFMLPKDE